MKLAYFVHDLTDPAVARRVTMLKAGGAEPVVLGFRRSDTPPAEVAGAPAIDLGRTYDGRMGQRARATLAAALKAPRLAGALARVDVIMARSLEMLAVARAARMSCGLDARLFYECLDIHRLMLGSGLKGKVMRAAERALLRGCDLLIVSSPAFLDRYFAPLQGLGSKIGVETLLVENKPLELDGAPAPWTPPPAGRPWRIGWLGAIRCRRSLDVLTDLARRRPDLVQVAIHGRPARGEFADFDQQVADAPGVTFGGAYGAADLPNLYGDVHFSWAIDFMEEGLNSAWLLPNRLYESSRYGVVPIAMSDVQTGRYLADRGFGLVLDRLDDLERTLDGLTADGLAELRRALGRVPVNAFVAGRADCVALVRAIAGGLIPHTGAPSDPGPVA